ncbi:hypothetical protein J4Q44_G00356240 [Coregonus suidteri]|uniref:Uncharacterized protein n=1 Tax=Coregonus suidteri TaxID=861788 RepID=A0AAN8KSN2_9TELE
MESGAEASPQQHQRRKPVMHGLEDQKRHHLSGPFSTSLRKGEGQVAGAGEMLWVLDQEIGWLASSTYPLSSHIHVGMLCHRKDSSDDLPSLPDL